MKQADSQTLVATVPDTVKQKAKYLLKFSENELTAVQIIQKRLVTDDRMRIVWPLFEAPSNAKDKSCALLFFDKIPALLIHGGKVIRNTQGESLKKLTHRTEKLLLARKQTKDLLLTLKALKLDTSIRNSANNVLSTLEDKLDDLVTYAWFWTDQSIDKEFGYSYRKAWAFKRKNDKNALGLFTIRAVYLLLRECGIENPPPMKLGIIVSVLLEKDEDTDKKSIKDQVRSLLGHQNFEKSETVGANSDFDKVEEDK